MLSGGPPGAHPIQGIGAGFVPEVLDLSMVDRVIPVSSDASFDMARRLAQQEGILCGISSGAAVAAALEYASGEGADDEIIVVVIPSFGERYIQTKLFDPYRYEGATTSNDSAVAGHTRLARPVVSEGTERREARKAKSRGRILEAARGIFFRDGFMDANLDEVARGAGVAKGTLYRYFENKADLYVAVLADNGELFERKMREAGAGPGSAPERVRRIADFYLAHWTANRDYFQIFWAVENQSIIGGLPEGVLDEVTRLWQSCLAILAEVVQQGIDEGSVASCDPDEVALILWTLANGLIQSEASPAHRRLRQRPLAETFGRRDRPGAGRSHPRERR